MTKNNLLTFIIRQAVEQDYPRMDALAARAFGPGRYARTAFRLREGVAPENNLCFVATQNDEIVGSVRLTRISVGTDECLILGPLMASSQLRNIGIGRELMNRALHTVKQSGHKYVILVGDLAYYQRFGFRRIAAGKISLPGPVDSQRLLGLELVEGASDALSGVARKILLV